MRHFLIVFSSLWLLFGLFSTVITAQQIDQQRVDELAQKYVKKPKNKGLVIGIVQKDDTFLKGYGKISRQDKRPPTGQTLFEIGAVTEVFTTTMAIHASMSGKFDFGEPVQLYLPEGIECPTFHPFNCVEIVLPALPGEPSSKGLKRIVSCSPDPDAETVCVSFCDLASHTAGFAAAPRGVYSWNPFLNIRQMTYEQPDQTQLDFYGNLASYELRTAPGVDYHYSNIGTALLGHILTDITKEPYDLTLKNTITGPLGMSDTRLQLTEEQEVRLAPGHNYRGKMVASSSFDRMAPAAGLKSSAKDMIRFVKANLQYDESTLSNAFAQAQQPMFDVVFPGVSGSVEGGYGWLISRLSPDSNLPVIWHNGGTRGYRAFVGFVKDTKTGVVILSNSSNSVDEIGLEILRLLNRQALSKTAIPVNGNE